MHGVLKNFHPMIGCDFHTLWPPGSPAPGGPVPHMAMSSLMGLGITADMAPMESTHFGFTIMRGSDIGPMIPHAGPPNCLLPVILLASGSKAEFGSSQYLIKGKPAAVALLWFVNPNLNCGDPAPAPLDGVIAITAHFVGMSWGDIFAGFFAMALDCLLQYALNKLGDKLFNKLTQKVYEKLLFGPMMTMFEHIGEGKIATWLLKNDLEEMLAKGFFAQLTKLVGSWTIGSPVGYSFPWNRLGKLDGAGVPEGEPGHMEAAHNAVRDAIDSPDVETHDVPPTAGADQSVAPPDASTSVSPSDDAGAIGPPDASSSSSASDDAGAIGPADASTSSAASDDASAIGPADASSSSSEPAPADPQGGVCLPDDGQPGGDPER
ncbi:MAG TPA: hypothetical protein VHM31_05180 [Polyangia bacterium]|nr:hypothetical protein [Polyangia bacterium]